jgi:hypothetical protein
MSDETNHTRREFVAGAIAVGGLVSLNLPSSATGATESANSGGPCEASAPATNAQLLLYDPEHAEACRRVADEARSACPTSPIVGDRVRLANQIFVSAKAPDVVAGFTGYADFIVLSGCAAEHGYRVTREETSHTLVAWTVARRPRVARPYQPS